MRRSVLAVASALCALSATLGPGGASAQAADAGSIALSVNSAARVSNSGSATVTGSYRCAVPDGYRVTEPQLSVYLSQAVGRLHQIQGFGDTTDLTCDGGTHNYAVTVLATGGKFGGGIATYSVIVGYCYDNGVDSFCTGTREGGTVKLRH